eukprot:5298761-Alexandrium_andersonii.AAC.1
MTCGSGFGPRGRASPAGHTLVHAGLGPSPVLATGHVGLRRGSREAAPLVRAGPAGSDSVGA